MVSNPVVSNSETSNSESLHSLNCYKYDFSVISDSAGYCDSDSDSDFDFGLSDSVSFDYLSDFETVSD